MCASDIRLCFPEWSIRCCIINDGMSDIGKVTGGGVGGLIAKTEVERDGDNGP